jgi:hypothetical protein
VRNRALGRLRRKRMVAQQEHALSRQVQRQVQRLQRWYEYGELNERRLATTQPHSLPVIHYDNSQGLWQAGMDNGMTDSLASLLPRPLRRVRGDTSVGDASVGDASVGDASVSSPLPLPPPGARTNGHLNGHINGTAMRLVGVPMCPYVESEYVDRLDQGAAAKGSAAVVSVPYGCAVAVFVQVEENWALQNWARGIRMCIKEDEDAEKEGGGEGEGEEEEQQHIHGGKHHSRRQCAGWGHTRHQLDQHHTMRRFDGSDEHSAHASALLGPVLLPARVLRMDRGVNASIFKGYQKSFSLTVETQNKDEGAGAGVGAEAAGAGSGAEAGATLRLRVRVLPAAPPRSVALVTHSVLLAGADVRVRDWGSHRLQTYCDLNTQLSPHGTGGDRRSGAGGEAGVAEEAGAGAGVGADKPATVLTAAAACESLQIRVRWKTSLGAHRSPVRALLPVRLQDFGFSHRGGGGEGREALEWHLIPLSSSKEATVNTVHTLVRSLQPPQQPQPHSMANTFSTVSLLIHHARQATAAILATECKFTLSISIGGKLYSLVVPRSSHFLRPASDRKIEAAAAFVCEKGLVGLAAIAACTSQLSQEVHSLWQEWEASYLQHHCLAALGSARARRWQTASGEEQREDSAGVGEQWEGRETHTDYDLVSDPLTVDTSALVVEAIAREGGLLMEMGVLEEEGLEEEGLEEEGLEMGLEECASAVEESASAVEEHGHKNSWNRPYAEEEEVHEEVHEEGGMVADIQGVLVYSSENVDRKRWGMIAWGAVLAEEQAEYQKAQEKEDNEEKEEKQQEAEESAVEKSAVDGERCECRVELLWWQLPMLEMRWLNAHMLSGLQCSLHRHTTFDTAAAAASSRGFHGALTIVLHRSGASELLGGRFNNVNNWLETGAVQVTGSEVLHGLRERGVRLVLVHVADEYDLDRCPHPGHTPHTPHTSCTKYSSYFAISSSSTTILFFSTTMLPTILHSLPYSPHYHTPYYTPLTTMLPSPPCSPHYHTPLNTILPSIPPPHSVGLTSCTPSSMLSSATTGGTIPPLHALLQLPLHALLQLPPTPFSLSQLFLTFTALLLVFYLFPSSTPHLHTICTPSAHYLHTTCTLFVHHLHTICTPPAHYLHTTCTLFAHHLHTICTPPAHYVHTVCKLFAHHLHPAPRRPTATCSTSLWAAPCHSPPAPPLPPSSPALAKGSSGATSWATPPPRYSMRWCQTVARCSTH